MQLYSPIILKFALGIICLIIQINLMGKGNLAPSSAMDQVQNYVLGGINKQIDEAAKKYFDELKKNKDQQ